MDSYIQTMLENNGEDGEDDMNEQNWKQMKNWAEVVLPHLPRHSLNRCVNKNIGRVRLSQLVPNANVPRLECLLGKHVDRISIGRKGGYSSKVAFIESFIAEMIRPLLR